MGLPVRTALLLLLAATALGCAREPIATPETDIRALAVPGRSNANVSTAAVGQLVVVSWTATVPNGGADAFVATSGDGGRSFNAPVQVNDISGTVRTAGEQAPRIAVSSHLIAVVWTARESDRSVVRLATSRDRGRTFGASRLVHPDGLTGARGWASVAIDSSDRAHVVWLDGRNANAQPMTHAMPGTMAGMDHTRAPRQDLYAAVIDGTRPITDRIVAADTCFCCKTTVAALADGSSLAAWRHLFPSNVRDIAVARFGMTANSANPIVTRVSHDDWEIHGCPEDGPAVAVDAAGATHIAWPTLVPGEAPGKGVFYATSTDGSTFSPRVRLDTTPGQHAAHPQIAATHDGSIAVVWEQLGQASHPIVMRTRAARAAAWTDASAFGDTARGVYPSVAAVSGGFVVAWTGDAGIQVRRVSQ